MFVPLAHWRSAWLAWWLGCAVSGAAELAPPVASSTAPKLPFRVDHTAPLAPEEQPLDEGAKFLRRQLTFNGIAGDRVTAHLYLPKGATNRCPAVLVQHGIGDKKRALYIVATCERLASLGVIAR